MVLRRCVAVVAGIAACLGGAVPAAAAVTIGQSPVSTGEAWACGPALYLQGAAEGAAYRVPSTGVITRWRTSFVGTAAFAVARADLPPADPAARLIALDERTTGGAGGEFDVRIPVQADDVIGLQLTAEGLHTGCLNATGSGLDILLVAEPQEIGAPFQIASGSGLRLNVEADVEPDTDGDGFGDETQDPCPGAAGANGCPPAFPDTQVPETKLKKKPKGKTTKRKVKFKFTSDDPAATFECKLDRKPWKACKSPKKVRVKPGRHRFKVRAIDAAGNADKSPAKARFRVVR